MKFFKKKEHFENINKDFAFAFQLKGEKNSRSLRRYGIFFASVCLFVRNG